MENKLSFFFSFFGIYATHAIILLTKKLYQIVSFNCLQPKLIMNT